MGFMRLVGRLVRELTHWPMGVIITHSFLNAFNLIERGHVVVVVHLFILMVSLVAVLVV